MHLNTRFLTLSWAATSLAFPSHQIQHLHLHKERGLLDGLDGLLDATSDLVRNIAQGLDQTLEALDPFDTARPIDVSGDHAFKAPSSNDQRGPCPGLNALANHGYINRDGITSLIDVTTAIHHVYGMAIDLALVLAIMGVVWTGDPISLDPSFSIGGNDTAVWNALNNVQGVLGTPQGIDYSHNFIEADSSPTRDDLYVTGNAWTMNMSRFEELYDTVQEPNGTFTFDVMASWASKRWHDSVQTNPYFYYGPFTGMIARNAGFAFITRLFANHTGGNPDGVITHDTLKSFFGVYGDRECGNMTYREGHEQIPANWYRHGAPYGLIELNLDVVSMILKYPELGSIGGNVGTVNSFTGVDLDDVLGGVLNAGQLLEGNNLLCFVLEVVKLASPNYLNNLYTTLEVPLELITNIIAAPLLDLSCPTWDDLTMNGQPIWATLEQEFSGANKSARAL
ncbi:Cloroperoxidase [Hortaea werneckii]|nr:Cloroperoxidase [Hortaea werneckii]KAI7325956.1 Cloroperoxidase [Hortaea werneckii]